MPGQSRSSQCSLVLRDEQDDGAHECGRCQSDGDDDAGDVDGFFEGAPVLHACGGDGTDHRGAEGAADLTEEGVGGSGHAGQRQRYGVDRDSGDGAEHHAESGTGERESPGDVDQR